MKKPTDAELEVLQILWKHGPSPVRFVHEKLNRNRPVVYTTTLKTMQVMTEKGFLKRDTSQRSHLYEVLISEEKIQDSMLDKLLRTAFRGSPSKLILGALGHVEGNQEELEEIKRILQKLEDDESNV